MVSNIEREIKLRYDTLDEARAAIDLFNANPLRARRLQDDRLLEMADSKLRDRHCTLRVRIESSTVDAALTTATVAFKGPPRTDIMKVREEIETPVGNGNRMLNILEKIGWRVWFRYQKYREEFECKDVIIAIDETPIGVFVELEGIEKAVLRLTHALGRTTDDYIVASYRNLYTADCASTGRPVTHMVFD